MKNIIKNLTILKDKILRFPQRHPFLLSLIIITLIVFIGDELLARAGGGGGYSGGGGGFSGGGGGGSGGGGGEAIMWLIYLCIKCPLLGIPLTIGIIVFFVYGSSKGANSAVSHHQGYSIRRGNRVQEQQNRDLALRNLCQRDSAFNQGLLTVRVQKAFYAIQDAWSTQNIDLVRPFVSDGIYERFSIQVAEQKEQGFCNKMENVAITYSNIAQIISDNVFDAITIKLQASAKDYNQDLKTGKQIGPVSNESFVEYWTFLRRLGAKSLSIGESGLIEGNCPNCGASLAMNETEKCKSCAAIIRSGEYDWVLTEITQACEWRATEQLSLPGIDSISSDDSGFSVQHLEDRASVMFWRNIKSLQQGKVDAIRKMSSDAYCQDLKSIIKADANGVRHYPGNCAVGSVDTLGIVKGENEDVALVEIRWSGDGFSCDSYKKIHKDNRSRVRSEVFVMTRNSSVKSDSKHTLSSAHCPSCGAAIHDSVADSCEYCNSVLNGGEYDWILQEIGSKYNSSNIKELIIKLQTQPISTTTGAVPASAMVAGVAMSQNNTVNIPPSIPQNTPHGNLALAAWMIHVMLSDGQIDAKEQQLLEQFAQQRQIPGNQIDNMINAMQNGSLEIEVPADSAQTKEWLKEMIKMALADGFIAKQEQKAISLLAQRLDYSQADIRQLILKVKRELYQQSRRVLREMRNR